ncbi:hypothetical protein C8R47DRAFT_568012 [Mycena vitilis]|nr:hypothetical protein C8R47DRAFT_568012 [Mycena vitilis]
MCEPRLDIPLVFLGLALAPTCLDQKLAVTSEIQKDKRFAFNLRTVTHPRSSIFPHSEAHANLVSGFPGCSTSWDTTEAIQVSNCGALTSIPNPVYTTST